MSWFRRAPDPFQHPFLGRMVWRKTRHGGYWDTRTAFPPTGEEVEVCIPGGRDGPGSVDALWQAICASFTTIQANVDADAKRECAEAEIVFGTLRLETLYFFGLSETEGDWKLIYRMGETEIHADGQGRGEDPPSVFVVE